MNRIIHAFGILASPVEVSAILSQLRIGHTLVSSSLRAQGRNQHLGRRQPAWPVVLPSIKALSRYTSEFEPEILFICDSQALLATCNIRILKPKDLEYGVRRALEYAVANPMASWALERKEMSISDYVNSATKPSYLNALQSEFYRITPYDLRKEVQNLVIGCLAGAESKSKLNAKLDSSHKLSALARLAKDPKFGLLKEAVAHYRASGSIEATAAATGFENFEILYIARSSEKTLRDTKTKKRKA